MAEEFLIPGMYICRADIQQLIFKRHLKLSEEEVQERTSRLTDGVMGDIAEAFASEFFDVREDLFREILIGVVEHLQVNYDRDKSLFEDA